MESPHNQMSPKAPNSTSCFLFSSNRFFNRMLSAIYHMLVGVVSQCWTVTHVDVTVVSGQIISGFSVVTSHKDDSISSSIVS